MNNMEKKVITLTVSKTWFDLICQGKKDEEYREIKPYWAQRLLDIDKNVVDVIKSFRKWKSVRSDKLKSLIGGGLRLEIFTFKPYTHVLFINGYGKNRPRVEKEIVSITIGKPKKGLCPDEWLDKEFFVIKFK